MDDVISHQCQLFGFKYIRCVCVYVCKMPVEGDIPHLQLQQKAPYSQRISGQSCERAASGCLVRSFDSRLPQSSVIWLEERGVEERCCIRLHLFVRSALAASALTLTECWCDLTGTELLDSFTCACRLPDRFTELPGHPTHFDASIYFLARHAASAADQLLICGRNPYL